MFVRRKKLKTARTSQHLCWLFQNWLSRLSKRTPQDKKSSKKLRKNGLNFVKFGTVLNSLRLAWIGRLLGMSYTINGRQSSIITLEHGSLLFLPKFNYDLKLLKKYSFLLSKTFSGLSNTAKLLSKCQINSLKHIYNHSQGYLALKVVVWKWSCISKGCV